MKDIINVIIGKEEISILEKYTSQDKEVFERYMNIVKEMIHCSKKAYNRGLSIELLIELVKKFFEDYNQNVILVNYYKHESSEEEMKQEVENMIERYLKQLNSTISIADEDIDTSFSSTSGVEENKVLSLSNGHPTGTETGFVSPILLSILTAVIELSTLLYIFLQTME